MPHTIGIDIQTTVGQKTGFGFYVDNLVRQLKVQFPQRQYKFFRPKQEADLSAPQRFIWDQFDMPRQAKRARIDVLHQPAFSAPVFYRASPVVVTVHDLIAIIFGADIPFFSRQFFSRWMPFSYRRADHIIAVSEHTKKDIIHYLKIPPEKISVIYEAADDRYLGRVGADDINQMRSQLGLKSNYLLHVGTLNPRKNLAFLIEVFAQVIKKHPDLSLVLTGKKGWYYENLFALASQRHLNGRVKFIDYVSDQHKPALYKAATAFCFPSIYEGFGLPPLEAMLVGTPVIAANVSSIPEVVGDGGLLVSPHDIKSWVEGIEAIVGRPSLAAKLVAKGKKQAARFSWSKTVRQTMAVYEKVIQENRS